MKRTTLIITCLLLSFFLPLQAQIFEYIDMDNGLSSRRVLSIQQDKQNYIWILTHKGLDRYNGKQFKHYQLHRCNNPLSFYPNLNFLYTDKDSTIWEVGKDGFVFRYDEQRDSFQLAFDLRATFPALKKAPISSVYMDSEANIWFCTNQSQYIYNYHQSKNYQLSPVISDKIICITQAEKNKYYLASEHLLYEVQLKGEQLTEIKKIQLPNVHLIDHIYYHSPTKQLIINTLLDKLFIYDIKEKQLESIGNSMKDIGVNKIIPSKKEKDVLLIATDGDGVYKLNLKQLTLNHFLKEDTHKPNKMNGSIIKDIYMDSANRIWNVIYPTGITIYTEKYPAYEWFMHSANYTNSLANNCINGVMEDSEGDSWYATSNGICYFDVSENKWINFSPSHSPNGERSENHIFTSLCESSPGIILAGGYMSSIYKIDKRTKEVTFFQQQNIRQGEGPDKYIRSIYRDNERLIWIGGFYRLKSYSLTTKEVCEYNIGYPITCITQKDEHSLWIGTINGVFVFDKLKKQAIPLDTEFDIQCINMIYNDPSGNYTYFGTYGDGLFIFEKKTRKVTRYYDENCGLISNNIYSIVPDRNGDLYLGTENGLSFFDIKANKFINWTKEQGLLAASFNPNAAIHSRDGYMIFGSNEGVIVLPDSIQLPETFSSHMIFSDLSIMYRTVHPGEKNSPLTQALDKTSCIELDYDQNTFSMNVSSINFDNPSNIMYSWKLEGFYDRWPPPSSDNLIRYTNLSPGNYTLRVRAILMDNHQILEEREIQILIGRPIWMTFWAFLLYALIIIGISYAIIRYQMIRRDKQISQAKINFFMQTAHDIRTPLTLIKAPLGEILKNEQLTEQGTTNLNLAIQSTDNLSELANNLMDFQKEELYSSKISVVRYELNQYIQNYMQQFKAYAEQKGIDFQYKSSFTSLEVWIDQNKIDSILQNLLSNALKYTPKGGSVTIETDHNKNRWILTIKDTGIGIPKEDQKKLFKFLFRGKNATNQLITGSGVGMLLTYRLIKNHEGKISLSSTENVGTTFQLSFPIQSEHYQYRNEGVDQNLRTVLLQDGIVAPMPEAEQTQITAHPDSPRIMIVEDNASLRLFLMKSLSDIYQVDGAENGQEAIDKIKVQQPDLIISDVMMSVMDGETMCRTLKSDIETSHIPIILLTALGDKKDILRGLETKADMYITKPFDLMVLRANISNILENREIIRKKLQQASVNIESKTEDIPMPTNLDNEFMQKVTVLVKENLGKDLTVDTLCAGMNMSRTSFYNKIKALTGMAPNDFIRNIRMQEAAALLKSQRYTVAEVADMMGFADPKYFTDTFKKFYGVPPSIYKKNEE